MVHISITRLIIGRKSPQLSCLDSDLRSSPRDEYLDGRMMDGIMGEPWFVIFYDIPPVYGGLAWVVLFPFFNSTSRLTSATRDSPHPP